MSDVTGIGVAISTTGDEHRMGFLETSTRLWAAALTAAGFPANVFVTVDGSEQDVERAAARVRGLAAVYRVGQPARSGAGRLGVAVNKNTGLELLVDAQVEHLFLSDDDCGPRTYAALAEHIEHMDSPHSMVNWGRSRLQPVPQFERSNQTSRSRWGKRAELEWGHPRGVMLYAHRSVVDEVGGMIESFGVGGHEHVEWSRRIFQSGLTRLLYPSPAYMQDQRGWGAGRHWLAEDMPRPGEQTVSLGTRRKRITSIKRPVGYWERATEILDRMDGKPCFIPFRAEANKRASATLYPTDNFCAEEPE